jgi:hypothetical protein
LKWLNLSRLLAYVCLADNSILLLLLLWLFIYVIAHWELYYVASVHCSCILCPFLYCWLFLINDFCVLQFAHMAILWKNMLFVKKWNIFVGFWKHLIFLLAVRKMLPLLCFQLVALFFWYLSWQNKQLPCFIYLFGTCLCL